MLNLVMLQLKLEKGLWNRHRKQGYDQDMDLEHHQIDGDAQVEHDSDEMSQSLKTSLVVPLVAKKREKTKYQTQWKRIMT